MKTKKIISTLFLITVLMNSIVMAKPAKSLSSDIPLGNFSVKPGEELKLPLDKLYVGVVYDIICTIKYQDVSSSEEYSHVGVSCTPNGNIYQDGDNLGACGKDKVVKYKVKGSKIYITDMRSYSQVSIRNLDYTDTISVSCIAGI